MKKKTVGFKVEEELAKQAEKWCNKNATTLAIQLRNFIKYLSNENDILKGGE